MHFARLGAGPIALLVAGALAGCATPRHPITKPRPAPVRPTGQVKIGQPYQVFGQWYYPSDDRSYDVTGIASWYGPGFHSLSTASGERYDQDGLSAAHKTLPLPSYVEVSNLDNGRTLVVRVNDRGPFVAGRVIDLSRKSAQLLGVDRPGTAHVRVRRVYPQGAELAALQPPPAPPTLIAALPPVVTVPLPSSTLPQAASIPPTVSVPSPASLAPTAPGTLFIQVAALSDQGRAEWLRGFLQPFGTAAIERSPSGLWRVRLGPYSSRELATPVLAQVQAAGYTDARTIVAAPGG